MKTIKLHGILADKFGEYFKLDVSTPREATHAIACQNSEFKRFMIDSEKHGMKFAVFLDERNIGEDNLDTVTGAEVIHVVPKVVGAGGQVGGFLQVIAGIALIGAGIFMSMNWALIGAGAGILLGGVATLLTPTPTMDKNEQDGNKANSKGFGGAVTTVAQGNPVPILYGEREIGGFFISGGMYIEDTM